ncbi:hypothetical protein BS78_03G135200 [Paspalum vaginatum]|nr:hypothetical protein BS78_03G135200 [Paspalum vaginatum]
MVSDLPCAEGFSIESLCSFKPQPLSPIRTTTMTTESEVPRITELSVRMDCNGCEHKIRKTLRAIDGVSEVSIDQANHKIMVVGMADPERIVKAIRKIKRVPTIFSHTNPVAEPQPPPAQGEAPTPADPPADAPPPEPEVTPAEPTPENKEATPPAETPVMDATVLRTVHDDPSGDGHRLYWEHWANHPMDMHGIRYDSAPYHVTNSYSHQQTSPYIAENGYGGSPVQEARYYSYDYYPARGKGDDIQITSMFSDENPNACSIA